MVRFMNSRDLFSGLFWLAISFFVCLISFQADIGTFQTPGAGFFPFWAGVILGSLSIVVIIHGYRQKTEGHTELLEKGTGWYKAVLVLILLLFYAILLPKLGYITATFGFLTFLFSLMKRKGIWVPVVSALFTATVTYVLFSVCLDVPLPKGVFGF